MARSGIVAAAAMDAIGSRAAAEVYVLQSEFNTCPFLR